MKEAALKDLLVTAPELMSSAFTEKSIVDSFVSAGMLDKTCKKCPNLYQLLENFKVPWGEEEGGQDWLHDKLPQVITEMYSEGEVSEQFFDDMGFPKDIDKKKVYGCSKVMLITLVGLKYYTIQVLLKKGGQISE